MSDPDQYNVGWICALQIEYVAARAFLERRHDPPERLSRNDNNHYTLGEIRGHQVVIAVLPDGEYGTSSAAGVARDMVHSFPNIRFGLMVGIGGGIPTKHDIRLGDIIVSSPQRGLGGLLQFDLGQELQGQGFHQTGFLNQPPTILRAAVTGLQTRYAEEGNQLKGSIGAVLEGNKRLKRKYAQPKTDRLYYSDFAHPDVERSCGEVCDRSKLIFRPKRTEEEDDPDIHYGLIASGNRVIKDATFRDQLAAERDVLCFEMEAAGLMNHFPCLVIRGVCDYADSHKSEEWQGWAAMAAAAYARDLLREIIPQQVQAERTAKEVLNGIQSQLDHVTTGVHELVSITSGSAQDINDLAQRIDLKALPIAAGAEFGTYMNQHEEECLPGTRKELLLDIQNWALSDQGKCIFWLNGSAGTGKSTISRTIAKAFQKQELLGASFFFKRGEGDRGNATRFVTTIIQQLAAKIPELRASIIQVVRDIPGISAKPLKEQFDELISKPLHSLHGAKIQTSYLVIVIDALDECDNDKDVAVIFELLLHVHKFSSPRLRFFITSRPELPIRLGFRTVCHHDLVLHEVPEPIIERDISMFLENKIVSIRHKQSLSSDWPGSVNIQTLIKMSVPLFIFAATICRLFEDYNLDRDECLMEILKYQNQESKLDKTYLPVLDRLVSRYSGTRQSQLVQKVREVLGTIILLENPLSVTSLSKLMGISMQSINASLNSLHSVLNIPNNKTLPVRLFHLSFRDFLLDSSTRDKTPFWIDKMEMNQKLADRCLSIMHQNLKKNICSLESYGTERSDIDLEYINFYVPPELQYACRYWIHHLADCESPISWRDNILTFLNEHFLHWVEVMSILGVVSEVLGSISTLQKVLHGGEGSEISEFLLDARRFILKNSQIADIAPLQIYASGLIFAPAMAVTRSKFERELPDWIERGPRVEETWSPELQTLEGHSDSVEVVTFSADGRLLASGSQDKTIKLWDPATGALKHTLEGHSGLVQSVAFSADGQLLASGSDDTTIKLWNPITSTLKHTLKVHTRAVQSVAFSADGRLLASGSHDTTINLLDPTTGVLTHKLLGRSGLVQSVAFSADGRLLASAFSDRTIKLWDPATGTLKHRLWGHSGLVQSVAFSADSQLLASGSQDKTIKLWDPATGALKHTLQGHSGLVQSVAFSADGRLLASGSSDTTIRIWDPTTGTIKHTLGSHSSWVRSVAFSADGRLLASGSSDTTIKLWDPATGAIKHTLRGHSGLVQSVAFSADGRRLASGSSDTTIKLWDPATGAIKHTLRGHSGLVQSVAFSADGRLLASISQAFVSSDRTIKLWDPATSALKHTGYMRISGSTDNTVKLWNPATGALKHTINIKSLVRNIELSKKLPHLITNLGALNIQAWHETFSSNPRETKTELSLHANRWIAVGGQKEVWLPPDYEAISLAVKDGTIAIGSTTGRITIPQDLRLPICWDYFEKRPFVGGADWLMDVMCDAEVVVSSQRMPSWVVISSSLVERGY
ncbi:putative wd40 protein [Aspergillus saccharolyticus JOP 1030-1]|uniref:Putative wd40 protein n=1 Tax=Aspergillus saccharolyticus JOP 1030-1 TaxID=1450539 RepID=A0A318ZHX0_9EURO|nr:putative wd40 protein [Aspergillus saccharolyticus JOP 1030-1]PYH47089.1 putative wd40 protein [Aspergillus saccharolyticus JOP 1030-1]